MSSRAPRHAPSASLSSKSKEAGGVAHLRPTNAQHAVVGVARGRISRITASFLRVCLLPLIVVGVPAWPLTGVLCAVPIIGIFTIPIFVLLTFLLLYSIAWFSYLVMAQADPPPSSKSTTLYGYLPFLPYSPLRCLKINWAVLQYSSTAVRLALPAVLDWCYRRVMVLGTQGGNGVVKEGILYGSPFPARRLDIYTPVFSAASLNGAAHAGQAAQQPWPRSAFAPSANSGLNTPRARKHSTHFAEPSIPTPHAPTGQPLAPVVVCLPSSIPPISWTNKRKTYLQLALRLRRMGYCVVVPDITYYPEARIEASVVDVRLVLQWVGNHCHRYGGDPRRIHLLGHGLSAHLALLTLVQEAVVLSREGFLDHAHRQQLEGEKKMKRWDEEDEDAEDDVRSGFRPGSSSGAAASAVGQRQHRRPPLARANSGDSANWVDEPEGEGLLPPGGVVTAGGSDARDFESHPGARRLASQLGGDFARGAGPSGSGEATGSAQQGVSFPSSGSAVSLRAGFNSAQASGGGPSASKVSGDRHHRSSGGASGAPHNDAVTNAEALISNGLRRVEIYEPSIEVPPIAGLMLLAGVSDVIKEFRDESERGLEHLSVLRRSAGPSHTACLLHSPAHLLYASKNILDVSLLPPKFLLIHGGKDAVVDISQSTLLNTLLTGCGVENVKLRAYRELGHCEAIAALFLGQSKAGTRYTKRILHDIENFIAS